MVRCYISISLIIVVQILLLFSTSEGFKCFNCEYFQDRFGNIVKEDGITSDEEGIQCLQKNSTLLWDSEGSTDWQCYEFTAIYKETLEFVERSYSRSEDDSLIGSCLYVPSVGDYRSRRFCYCNQDACNVDLKDDT